MEREKKERERRRVRRSVKHDCMLMRRFAFFSSSAVTPELVSVLKGNAEEESGWEKKRENVYVRCGRVGIGYFMLG